MRITPNYCSGIMEWISKLNCFINFYNSSLQSSIFNLQLIVSVSPYPSRSLTLPLPLKQQCQYIDSTRAHWVQWWDLMQQASCTQIVIRYVDVIAVNTHASKCCVNDKRPSSVPWWNWLSLKPPLSMVVSGSAVGSRCSECDLWHRSVWRVMRHDGMIVWPNHYYFSDVYRRWLKSVLLV